MRLKSFLCSICVLLFLTGCNEIYVKNKSLPLCKIGKTYYSNSYKQTPPEIDVIGGSGSYKFSIIAGSLPAGLDVNSLSGVISGKCIANPGKYEFVLKVVDRYYNYYTVQPMAIIVTQPDIGNQPYETIEDDPRAYYVHQAASVCGHTSFYTIFKFFGHHLSGNGPSNVDLTETIPNSSMVEFTSKAKMYKYIEGIDPEKNVIFPSPATWKELEDAAYGLEYNVRYGSFEGYIDWVMIRLKKQIFVSLPLQIKTYGSFKEPIDFVKT